MAYSSCDVKAVFHLDPQRPGENSNVQGGRSMGVIEGVGLGGLEAVPPENFFEILQQICVEKQFFTVVNRQKYSDNNKNSSPWTNFCEDPHCQFTVCYSVSHNVYNEHRCLTRNILHCQIETSTSYEHWRIQGFSQGHLSPRKTTRPGRRLPLFGLAYDVFSVKFHSLPMRCPMHMQHVNAVITPVYWYFHCHFQQNIALFCAISEFVLLLLFADASCLIQ